MVGKGGGGGQPTESISASSINNLINDKILQILMDHRTLFLVFLFVTESSCKHVACQRLQTVCFLTSMWIFSKCKFL